MKKALSLFLTLVLTLGVFCTVPIAELPLGVTAAAASTSDLTFELNWDGKSYSVRARNTSISGKLTLPSKYNGKPVTEVRYFESCRGLTSVIIPNSVKHIGEQAFCGCTGLTSLIIPDSVESTGPAAFVGCTNLKSVKIGKNLKELLPGLFQGCTALSSITLSDNITYISHHAFDQTAFYNKSSNWENGVLYLQKYLIEAKTSISGSYKIKNGTKLIAEGAFDSCKKLTSVTIPNSVTSICSSAFSNSGLTSVTIPGSVKLLYTWTFEDCTALKSVKIESGVKEISGNVFEDCTRLTSITIPNSVTSIGYGAFLDCKNLKTVRVGKNAAIDSYALGYYRDSNNNYKKISGFTIYGVSGTKAQTYAKYNGFKFVNVAKPGTVKLSGAANVTTGVKVSWSKLSGADTYTVYRKSGSNGYKAIKSGLTGTSYIDKTAKSGTTYTYTVRATNIAGVGGYNKTGKSVKYLAAPQISSIANTTNGVSLKWNKVTGAKGYYVYRKIGDGNWKKLATIGGTSYVDKSAKSGTTYKYTVCAYSGNAKSGYVTKTIKHNKNIAAPQISSIANTTDGVSLKWNKVTGAKGYYVYRKIGDGNWKKLATIGGTSYVDKSAKSGTTYKYTVRAYSGNVKSSYTSKTIKCLAVPELNGAISVGYGITLLWSDVTGADGYYVYRKTGNGDYKKTATVSGNSTVVYIDTDVKSGTTYTYTVKAYSGKTVSAHNTNGLKVTV